MANPRQEDRSTQSMEDARRAGERTAEQTARIRQTAVEQTRRVGEAAAEAGEEVARASAHLLKQNAETLQDVLRFGLDMTTAVMGRSTDQLGHTLGLSGVNQLTSGVNSYFADFLVKRSARAIVRAYRAMRPASIREISSRPSIRPERCSALRRMVLIEDWRFAGMVSSRSRICA